MYCASKNGSVCSDCCVWSRVRWLGKETVVEEGVVEVLGLDEKFGMEGNLKMKKNMKKKSC